MKPKVSAESSIAENLLRMETQEGIKWSEQSWAMYTPDLNIKKFFFICFFVTRIWPLESDAVADSQQIREAADTTAHFDFIEVIVYLSRIKVSAIRSMLVQYELTMMVKTCISASNSIVFTAAKD